MSDDSAAEVKQTPAQASGVTFELHTLGWDAFQNLCGCVLSEESLRLNKCALEKISAT